jgi:hypothetical protein
MDSVSVGFPLRFQYGSLGFQKVNGSLKFNW